MDDQLKFFESTTQSDVAGSRVSHSGQPRLKVAERHQIEFRMGSLDDLIPEDHIVRLVWDFVNRLDTRNLMTDIQSVKGSVGRPATDPKTLLTLWLYATLEGIVSARVISEYCEEHIAYQWICGGAKVNHHTLSDFAADHGEQFDDFLTQSIAILMKQGTISLEEVAQDGMRVRACAGGSSFKSPEKLSKHYKKAKKYLAALKKESVENPSSSRTKKAAASMRAAKERERRVKEAIEELEKLKEEKKKTANTSRARLQKMLEDARASTTDSESRKMKMACGGFRPAYNVQFATTKKGRAIIAVDVNNRGNDSGLILGILEKVHRKYGVVPKRWLVDTGYANYAEITKSAELGCKIYMPPKVSGRVRDPYKPRPDDSAGIIEWRKRMNSDEGREIYKGRSSVAEFPNAQCRNKGLQQFLVRGLKRVKAVAYRFALVHNMQRFFSVKAMPA